MVLLHVAVFDRDGQPARGLTADDFVVIDNGVEYEVALALSPEVAPIDVALIFDQSESIRESAPTIKRDARAFLDTLGPEDCAFVLPFQHRMGPGEWGRPTDATLLETIDRAPVEGGTSLHDALILGLSEVQSWTIPNSLASSVFTGAQTNGRAGSDSPFVVFGANASCGPSASRESGGATAYRRKALVVLTDGKDTTSRHSWGELLDYVGEADVPVFAVAMGDAVLAAVLRGAGSPASRIANWRLRTIAESTGGQYVRGTGSEDRLRDAYGEIVTTLRASYLVGFYPREDHFDATAAPDAVSSVHTHDIEVRMRRPGYRVTSRAEYLRGEQDSRYARASARRGVELMRQRRFEEALYEAESSILADPSLADGHFLKAVALFMLGRHSEAEAAVRSAVELEPGVAALRQVAWQVHYELGDDEAAWQDAIRAHHAGADMDDEIEMLRARSEPPDELALRLDAPLIFVESSNDNDPQVRARLAPVVSAIARGVSRSPGLGLAGNPQAAHYFVSLDADDPDRRRPRRLDANLELYNYASRRLRRYDLNVDDIADSDAVAAAVDEALAELVDWLTRGRQEDE